MDEQMFHVEMRGDVALLTAKSRFEGPHRVAAREQIDGLLETGSIRLVIDFTHVDRIDSSGLASVVAAFRRTQAVGGELCICGLTDRVRTVFELTLLHEVIPIVGDREEAVVWFEREREALQDDSSTT